MASFLPFPICVRLLLLSLVCGVCGQLKLDLGAAFERGGRVSSDNVTPVRPITALWDNVIAPFLDVAAIPGPMLWILFDLGALHRIASVRLFGCVQPQPTLITPSG
jgi:hypothetical protein